MAAKIEIEALNESEFRVRVSDNSSESVHRVRLGPQAYQRLTAGKVEPRELVRRSFEFLLEREPKESILTRFDLSVISRYFPEYQGEIKRRLS